MTETTQLPLNQWNGITLNITGDVPGEEKFIVKENIDFAEAWELAQQCRKTHPDEDIELIPVGSTRCVTVKRVVRK